MLNRNNKLKNVLPIILLILLISFLFSKIKLNILKVNYLIMVDTGKITFVFKFKVITYLSITLLLIASIVILK